MVEGWEGERQWTVLVRRRGQKLRMWLNFCFFLKNSMFFSDEILETLGQLHFGRKFWAFGFIEIIPTASLLQRPIDYCCLRN